MLTISEHARQGIVEHIGVPADRVWSIPLGVDHERFARTGRVRRDGLRLPARYVLYPANMWPHKNHARLLDAFGARRRPELWLVLTGQTYGARAPARADARGCATSGTCRATDLPALYRGATALVFPSLFEGFGLPPLEAMACGSRSRRPSAASLAEVCGDAALLVRPRADRGDRRRDPARDDRRGAARTPARRRPARAARYTWAADRAASRGGLQRSVAGSRSPGPASTPSPNGRRTAA